MNSMSGTWMSNKEGGGGLARSPNFPGYRVLPVKLLLVSEFPDLSH